MRDLKVSFVDSTTPYNWNIEYDEETGLYKISDGSEYCLSVNKATDFQRTEDSRYVVIHSENLPKKKKRKNSLCSFWKIEKRDEGYRIIFQLKNIDQNRILDDFVGYGLAVFNEVE
jgi:hypothetical protein